MKMPFSDEIRLVQGKFVMDESGKPALYVEEWAEYLEQTEWFARFCRTVNFEPGEKDTFEIWLAFFPF